MFCGGGHLRSCAFRLAYLKNVANFAGFRQTAYGNTFKTTQGSRYRPELQKENAKEHDLRFFPSYYDITKMTRMSRGVSVRYNQAPLAATLVLNAGIV